MTCAYLPPRCFLFAVMAVGFAALAAQVPSQCILLLQFSSTYLPHLLAAGRRSGTLALHSTTRSWLNLLTSPANPWLGLTYLPHLPTRGLASRCAALAAQARSMETAIAHTWLLLFWGGAMIPGCTGIILSR